MNRLVTLLGVMALAALVWAQGTTGISGTITNADTGQPIAGALVGAWQNFGPPPDSGQMPPQRGGHRHQRGDHDRGPRGHHGQLGVRSDSTGFYEIADLRPGKYVVSAQAMGFEPATYPDTVTVDSGKITTGINLALQFDTTLGAATGHVTDAVTQQPIAGAFVCTWHQMLPDSCHRRPEPDSGLLPPPPDGDSEHGCRGHRGPRPDGDSTDAGGYYRINYLRPGNYIVSAQASGYASSTYPETVVVAKCETTFGINFALQPDSVTSGSKASAAGLSGSGNNGSTPGLWIVPNPSRSHTTVLFLLPAAADVSLRIYDVSGKLMNDVAQGYFEAGNYAAGIPFGKLSHGTYIARLSVGSDVLSQKLVVH